MITSTTLRIGAYNVSERDVTLLRGLVKLNAHTPQGEGWEYVDAAPYDLVFVDGDTTDARRIQALSLTAPTVKLVKTSSNADPHTLQRPFSSDSLLNWLVRARELAVNKPIVAARPAAAPQPPAPALPTMALSAQFKLLKWPPAALLRGDPARIRMATMLAKQALKVKELAHIAQQPVEHVVHFLNALHAMGLLLVGQPNYALAGAPAPITPHKQASAVRGFIGLLRKKLGV